MFSVLLLYALLQNSDAVIYRLNASEYAQMPPMVNVDPYETCGLVTDALYCTAEFALISDQPSLILDMIKGYSEHEVTHYNHSRLRYGICVTQTCKKFYNTETGDLKLTLEACLNESFTNKYDLKVKILEGYHCWSPGKPIREIDNLDIIVAAVCGLILLFNVFGSLYDYYSMKKEYEGLQFLLSFSLQRNWNSLMAPEDTDPRFRPLKGFNGIRVYLTCLVIIGHTFLNAFIWKHNLEFIEQVYRNPLVTTFMNSTICIQTFLMMSSFLLVYNWLHSKDKQISWSMLPRYCLDRWFRLTPAYAIVLAITATWFGHLNSGPLWEKCVGKPLSDCRNYWWLNLLYINNFANYSECSEHGWYLSTDLQLYILGVIVYLACRTGHSRKIVLSILFVAGMILPAAHVYFQNLDGILIVAPETVMHAFLGNGHFDIIYKRSYANVSSYMVGMALAFLVYHCQEQGTDFTKYKNLRYRLMFWSLIPLIYLCLQSGSIFYFDAPRPSVYIRMAYAAFLKPLFSVIVAALLFGLIFKIESFCRGMLEWSGWTVCSRLSYSAYLIHDVIFRSYIATQTENLQTGFFVINVSCFFILATSFLAALCVWLLVETPFRNITRDWFKKPKKISVQKENSEVLQIK